MSWFRKRAEMVKEEHTRAYEGLIADAHSLAEEVEKLKQKLIVRANGAFHAGAARDSELKVNAEQQGTELPLRNGGRG